MTFKDVDLINLPDFIQTDLLRTAQY